MTRIDLSTDTASPPAPDLATDDFDFHLPDSAIAQRPAPRGQSRLLVLDAEAEARHRRVADLVDLLQPGDLLVANDTRVIPARLEARRPGGGRAEILLLERLDARTWRALARPSKRLRPGLRLTFEGSDLGAEMLDATSPEGSRREIRDPSAGPAPDGSRRIRFDEPVEPHLATLGHVPLPPYIRRPDEAQDRADYQTVFARADGAVAAPTAGLHFDQALLERLEARGIERTTVTLHVGIGTFRPVTAERVADHRMDSERYEVSAEAANAIARTKSRGGRVVAIGTTVVRTLESAAREAALAGQETLARSGRTELFVVPGYRFRIVDALLTNFHLPRSTLLMMISAFAGRERVLAAYREAIAEGYRFYSYGDAMLLERRDPSSG